MAFRFSPTHARVAEIDRQLSTIVGSAGFMTELPATREATRGARDPMYLNYTLGKLLILELRGEMKRRPGYTFKAFHDAFLGAGSMPIPLIRELIR